MLGLMLLANFAFIYIPGLLGLGLWIYMVKGTFPTFLTLISMGLLPFILGDLVKIGGAAALTKAITPKEEY
jgi:biotin transport system substrate-specific component